MHVLIAPDSFKGSLTAKEVALNIQGLVENIFPEASHTLLPFSDGGEGALTVLQQFTKGKMEICKTFDPFGRNITAPYYSFDQGNTVWIELSQSSGLTLLTTSERNPLLTSTYGTGILIRDALRKGCKKIYLGIGGSATHDLGTGIFLALGGRLLNSNGKSIALGGGDLIRCSHIDRSGLDPALKSVQFTVACDVSNPLLGPEGAAQTYAPQKGATEKVVKELENNGRYFSKLMKQQLGSKVNSIKGGGAAGGTAAGLVGLLNANLKSGFTMLSDLANLEEKIKLADLVITGEGHFDKQSSYGKAPFSIAKLALKHNIPTLILAGKVSVSKDDFQNDKLGIYAVKPKEMPLKEALKKTPELLRKTLTPILENFKKNQRFN